MQQQAGFFIEHIETFFSNKQYEQTVAPLLNLRSHYELNTTAKLQTKLKHPLLSVLHNLLVRNSPAPASDYIQRVFEKAFARTERQVNSAHEIRYAFTSEDIKDLYLRALHTQKFTNRTQKFTLTSNFQIEVFEKIFPKELGDFFTKQLVLNTKYSDLKQNTKQLSFDFYEETIPFLINFPYPVHGKYGLIIETDEADNEQNTDYIKLHAKTTFAEKAGYDLLVMRKSNIEDSVKRIQSYTYNSFFDILKRNEESPIASKKVGKDAMQIALSPFGIGAIQKTLLDFIFAGALNLTKTEWQIAVKEHDVPVANLAVEDFCTTYKHLCVLADKKYDLPNIRLTVLASDDYFDSPLQSSENKPIKENNFDKKIEYDLFIDFSAIQFANSEVLIHDTSALNYAQIRASQTANSEQVLKFTHPISYENLFNIEDSKIREALNFFAASIFRLDKFSNEQLRTLSAISKGESSAHIGLTTEDKIIVTAFASLLQPALSLIIPNNELAADRWNAALKRYKVSSALTFGNSSQNLNFKRTIFTKIARNTLHFCTLSSGHFQSKNVFQLIEEQLNNKGYLAHLFIDGLNETSEFDASFSVLKGNLAHIQRKFRTLSKGTIQLTGFAPYSNYLIHKEFNSEFGINSDNIFEYQSAQITPDIRVIPVESDAEQGENSTPERWKKFYNAKYLALTAYLKQIPEDEQVLIILPEQIGQLGLISDSKKHFAQRLQSEFEHRKIADTEAVTEFGLHSGFSEIVEQAIANIQQFSNGKIDFLLTLPVEIPDFNELNLKHIVLMNAPASLEQLLTYSAYFSKDIRNSELVILYDTKEISTYERNFTTFENGRVENMEEIQRISTDAFFNKQLLNKRLPGRQKELRVTTELLSEIEQAQTIPADSLERRIDEEFGIKTELSSSPAQNPYQLHLNCGTKTYGHLDYRTGSIITRNSGFPVSESVEILDFLKTEILKRYGDNTSFFSILFQKNKRHNTSGIENMLNRMRIGEDGRMEIGLYNNAAQELYELLDIHFPQVFSFETVDKAIQLPTAKECFDTLATIQDIRLVNETVDIAVSVNYFHLKYRNQDHTLRALYRLQALQIVESFRINFGTETVEVFLHKIPAAEYKEFLKKNCSKYLTMSEAQAVADSVAHYEGETVLQKSVNRYINFCYDLVANENLKSLMTVDKFCKTILLSKKEIDKKEILHNELKMKYLPSLLSSSEVAPLDTALRFLRAAGNVQSERKHLAASVISASAKRPNSLLFNLLKSYTGISETAADTKAFENQIETLAEIFAQIELAESDRKDEQLDRKIRFLNYIFTERPEIREDTEPLFFLKTHADWLEQFNKKIFKNMFQA